MRLTSHTTHGETMKCPWCRAAYGPAPRRHANVTLYPELKDRVVSLALFTRICKGCGREFQIGGPFVYHDMVQRLWVEVERAGGETAPDHLASLESLRVMTPRRESGYRIRVVDSVAALRETVLIIGRGLSDLAVQTIKRAALANAQMGASQGARFENARTNGTRTLILFSPPGRKGEPLTLEVDTGFFDRFAPIEKAYVAARTRTYVDNLTIGELAARYLDSLEGAGRGHPPRVVGEAGVFGRLHQAEKPVWLTGGAASDAAA